MSKYILSEKVKYLFWGIVTTVFYLVVRLISIRVVNNDMIPVLISQFLTILFAFIVNKFFVFSQTQKKNIFVQFMNFILGRLVVTGLDLLLTYIMIDKYSSIFIHLLFLNKINFQVAPFSIPIVHSIIPNSVELNSFIVIILIQIIAIVVNYIISKYLIFD
ncbi:GtrA family protein [Leuconostoc suionicum]|uniref:GtrA family protein n=1 Tax=Leuconostoc suionicum TaxID=1511761 RepID=UPI00233F45DA|nr:GtrA family protein [Leuconostoc suionicum]MDC2806893.1 GtrA family protein [Leuconostoc suionicum]MDC2824405.1 GtrA family protein [Leuconostoc suionicum]